jgi:catechol 2,3-dioxygenase-like lactoylglutathione lyase family enzyme
MAGKFTISRVGHVGIYVSDVDRSIDWYTNVLGLTLTGRWPFHDGGEIVFMRFGDDHHNIVLMPAPEKLRKGDTGGNNRLQHIAMEMETRDEWLKALAALKRAGVAIRGPLVHGFEGGMGPGTLEGGSGSRSFYFEDPDGNSLELYTDMMTVPDGQPFPTPDYKDMVDEIRAERAKEKAKPKVPA